MEKEKKKLNTYTFQSVAFFEANVHADIEAESEEDAREQAIAWYVGQLHKGEIELLVEEEC